MLGHSAHIFQHSSHTPRQLLSSFQLSVTLHASSALENRETLASGKSNWPVLGLWSPRHSIVEVSFRAIVKLTRVTSSASMSHGNGAERLDHHHAKSNTSRGVRAARVSILSAPPPLWCKHEMLHELELPATSD